ncbi:tetratricopeptide repeat protein [Xanthobacter oligotrophicus]|uniref:tetratricopeptide repeat protein n=1 Tax=Xanthobacter oligotrophicus TaxID=2607286 RepID=UPI0011F0E095|nr:tetratricopeptide repeat protein [Xanthobacter oligotrophicus]MCG5234468.1 tetratricopeptide repeat protein [Xanthobacter oligotrophicus]
MTDIFHEIEEDLRRERLRKLWDRFGGLIIAAIVLVVVGAAGWSGYRYWRHQQAVTASAAFQSAISLFDAGKFPEAEAAFAAVAKDGPAGYRSLALFRGAAAAAARDKAAGVAAFDAIAADAGLPTLVRDLAQLRAALILVDTAGLAEVKQRVAAVAAGTGPLRNAAREALALAELKAGDAAAANKTATEITSDSETPPGVRSRAELIRRLTAGAEPAAPESAAPAPAAPGGAATQ